MDKLDQFFKKKLENREFDFQESYWQEAEKLIEQDRRKKRFAWWWRLSGLVLLLLLVTAGLWWYLSTDRGGEQTGQSVEGRDSIAYLQEKRDRADSLDYDGEGSGLGNSAINETVSEGRAEKITDGQPMDIGELTKSEVQPDNKNEEQEQFQKVTSGRAERRLERPGEIPAGEVINKEEVGLQKEDKKKLLDTMETAHDKKAIAEEITGEKTAGGRVAQRTWGQIGFLPVALGPIGYEPAELVQPGQPGWVEEATLRTAPSRWAIGLHFNAAFYPYANADAERLIGFAGGVNFEYKLSWRYNLEAALRVRQRTGTFEKVAETSVLYYGFGRSEATFNLLPSSLYYLELPLGVSRAFGVHHLEAGVVTSHLLGVQGGLKNVLNPEAAQGAITEDDGWIDPDGFKKWHWNVYLQYGLHYHRNMAVTLGVYYTLGGLLDAQFDAVPDPVLLESRPVFIDIGIQYKLF